MRKLPHRIIWAFGLGYFAFYAPYSGLTKALTSGRLPGVPAGISGLEIVPATIAGTIAAVVLMLTLLGWWRHALGITAPVILSGFATALIIGCTTLLYTFDGVTIVLALLLMRGGVLIMAPLMDLLFARKVRWFSWVAVAVAVLAVVTSVSAAGDYAFSYAAAITLALYLTGYLVRLSIMTRCAKVEDPARTLRYFVQELVVAMLFLVVLSAAMALVMPEVRAGYTTFWFEHRAAVVPALFIGALYAGLFVFGTLIYLDRRENSFCIPVNRGSSVLAGLVSAFTLGMTPPTSQLVSTALIVLALMLLSPFHHVLEDGWEAVRGRARVKVKPSLPPA
jgi:hypothetical protein